MAMDIYTIGGGEIIYEVLKAVSLCLNGGSGTIQGLITIGGISGAFMVYFLFLYGNIEQIMKTWAIPMTAMLSFLFVPTTTVWVHDEVSVFNKKLDNVPYGLAVFSSNVSKLGKAITGLVEQNFSLPDDLHYHKSGMMFGSDILEKARDFKIVNQNFRENMRNFVGQCVKYDIMLNNKYTFDDLRESNDVWSLVTSNPSNSRGIFWIPCDGGKAQYVTCAGAVAKFNVEWNKELEKVSLLGGKKMFSGRAIGHSSLTGNKLKMTPQLTQMLRREFLGNIQSTYGYLGDLAQTSEELLRQNVIVNAIGDSASENARASGNTTSYAEMKALVQQNFTFETVGRLAAKVLPIMKSIIEALVYACFIFIIPLCLIPSGYKFLFSWISTLVWLQAWAPMYAILNFIMNIAARSSTLAEIGTSGGLTIANIAGVSEANAEMKTLAGYLAISIPFICIAVVKGVGTFVHMASQMTGATTQAAASTSGELAGGNFSYGNVSLGNSQMGNVSQLQRNMNSSLGIGGHTIDTGGVQTRNDISGSQTITKSVSSGLSDPTASFSDMTEMRNSFNDSINKASSAGAHFEKTKGISQTETQKLANTLSQMSAHDVSSRYSIGVEKAEQLVKDARVLSSHYDSKDYAQGTSASGNVSFNIGKGGGDAIGGGVGASANVHANNNKSFGDSNQAVSSEDINNTQRSFDSAIKDIASSSRNDEVTQMSRDHMTTMSLANQYKEEQATHLQEAQNWQNSISSGQSMSMSESIKLRDEAIEIAHEKQNMTRSEAAKLIDSRRPEDQAARNSILREAEARELARQNPRMPSMKQPAMKQIERHANKLNFTDNSLRSNYYKDSRHLSANSVSPAASPSSSDGFNTRSSKQRNQDSHQRLSTKGMEKTPVHEVPRSEKEELQKTPNKEVEQGELTSQDKQMSQMHNELRVKKVKVDAKVGADLSHRKDAISLKGQGIQAQQEQIKHKVTKRAKDGAIVSAGKKLLNTILGNDD